MTVYRNQRPRFLPNPQLRQSPQTATLLSSQAPPFALPSAHRFVLSQPFHLAPRCSYPFPASGIQLFSQRSNGAQTAVSPPSPENPRPSSALPATRPKASPTAKWRTLSVPLGVLHSISRWLHREGWICIGVLSDYFSLLLCFLVYGMGLNLLAREIGSWSWDVCAGIVIAQEAGGVVTGSHEAFTSSSSSSSFGDVTEEILTGRKYVVVRAVGDTDVSSSFSL